jgi:poly-gamma-glutamate synthesis protein (capsule biosynthesis protein)
MFNYHPSLVADLKDAGIDVLLTANNHALDRQSLGVDRTIEAIQAAGLPYTGTRHRGRMDAPWYAVTPATVGGVTYNVAWLGCTYGTNEIPDPNHQVLYCYEQQDEVLATLRDLAARPDIAAVFLVPHWGREYRHDPNPPQRKLALAALEAGATGVIGTHPHVLEPFETYRTSDGRETFVAYSLGNFISGQSSLARRTSVILLLALMPDGKGKLAMSDLRFIPTHVVPEDGGYFVEAIDRAGRGLKSRELALQFLPAPADHARLDRRRLQGGRDLVRRFTGSGVLPLPLSAGEGGGEGLRSVRLERIAPNTLTRLANARHPLPPEAGEGH